MPSISPLVTLWGTVENIVDFTAQRVAHVRSIKPGKCCTRHVRMIHVQWV